MHKIAQLMTNVLQTPKGLKGLSDDLSEICRRHILQLPLCAVVAEPYIPFIPKKWNGTLVLAEAQNLSKGNPYARWLSSATPEERIRRLGRGDRVAIQPWDDGSLKLAVEAALGVEATRTAVSNGVLWSLVDEEGNNKNPTSDLIKSSKALWSEMFAVLKPEHVVTAGAIARRVVAGVFKKYRYKPRCTAWPLPSPRVFSLVSKTVNERELLQRFPEVAKAIGKNPAWIEGTHRESKILFSCLAVAAMNGSNREGAIS